MLISIIIPVFNVEKYLTDCLNSVLAQTYDNWELILVDDGSTDKSGQICDDFAQKDSRIRVFHKPNGGVSSARNLGIDNASGEWIYFIDSDDYIEPDSLASVSCVANPDKTDLVVHGLENDFTFCNKVRRLVYSDVRTDHKGHLLEDLDKLGLLKGPFNKLFKTEIIRSGLSFDTSISFGEDTKFTFNYLNSCQNFTFVPKYLYHYVYRRGNSLCRRYYDYVFWQSMAQMLMDVRIPVAKKFDADNSYYNFILSIYSFFVFRAVNSLYSAQNKIDRYNRIQYLKRCKSDEYIRKCPPVDRRHLKYKLLFKVPAELLDCILFVLRCNA